MRCWPKPIIQTWENLSLRVGLDHRQYTVQLIRQFGCVEAYRIFVDDREIEDHQLTYNPCSPLCGAGGQFEFEQDGHAFLLMYNSLSKEFCLFIDGMDVESGREFSAFWRRRGGWYIVFGLVLVILGIVLFLVFHFTLSLEESLSLIRLAGVLAVTGIMNIITGIVPAILRYRKPRCSKWAAVEPLETV